MVTSFLDADDNPDSHQTLIITFWPYYSVTWNLHANWFALSRQINNQKYEKLLLCADNKVFETYQTQVVF